MSKGLTEKSVELAQNCERGRKPLLNRVDPPEIIMIDLTDFDDDEVDKMKPMNTKDNFKCQLCEAIFLNNRQLVIHQTKHRLDIYHCLNFHCLEVFRSHNDFLDHSAVCRKHVKHVCSKYRKVFKKNKFS